MSSERRKTVRFISSRFWKLRDLGLSTRGLGKLCLWFASCFIKHAGQLRKEKSIAESISSEKFISKVFPLISGAFTTTLIGYSIFVVLVLS